MIGENHDIRLPRYLAASEIYVAEFSGVRQTWIRAEPSWDVPQALSHQLHLRAASGLYTLEYRLSAGLRPPSETCSEVHAMRRGLLEYDLFPARLATLSRQKLEGVIVPGSRRLVPRRRDIYSSRGSPFKPAGEWEKLPSHPTAAVVAARLVVDRSTSPYPLFEILNKLIYNSPDFQMLTITYASAGEGRPRSGMTSRMSS